MKKNFFAILAMAAALCASAETIELLTNGEGTTLESWENHGQLDGSFFAIQTIDDVHWFASSYRACRLSQTVTLSGHGVMESDIHANPTVTASGMVWAAQTDSDGCGSTICRVKVYELDAAGEQLQEHVIMDRSGDLISDPATFSNTFSLNSNTRKLKYELAGQDSVNWAGNYGPRFRNCSLSLTKCTLAFVSEGTTIGTTNFLVGVSVSMITPPIASREGAYHFLGYYTEETGGTQVYDGNYSSVSAWKPAEDTTLYAHWRQLPNCTFVSEGATIGTDNSFTAPTVSRSGDYQFLGYFTEDGLQVYDEDFHFVQSSLSSLSSDVTLYAHWGVPEGSIAKLVYRGQLDLLAGGPAVNDTVYTKKMHFRVYDSSEATTPLWTTGEGGIEVTVNKDGSFVQEFGDDALAGLLATGTVTHVGLAIGDSAMELKPRRELRPVAAVNHALTAEGAALDIRIGNLVTDNALVAADATVSQLEVTGRVTAPGAGKVTVSPLTVGDRERTRLMRGAGVKAFSAAKPTVLVADTGAKLRGEVIATAPADGIALITSKAGGERAFRCPAVVQYCQKGESVRAPTSDAGGLKVTFFPFIGKEVR